VRRTIETGAAQYFRCGACGEIWSVVRADHGAPRSASTDRDRESHRARDGSPAGDQVATGTGHVWRGGERVAPVHYLLVDFNDARDGARRRHVATLFGVLRFAEADAATADAIQQAVDLALELEDGRHLPCSVQQSLGSTPRRWMVTLTSLGPIANAGERRVR
jgi:hypothetical protein